MSEWPWANVFVRDALILFAAFVACAAVAAGCCLIAVLGVLSLAHFILGG